MRIDIIYGTRPELIKLALVILRMKEAFGAGVRVISTGQHKEMLLGLEEWFGILPDISLQAMKEGQSLGHLSAALLVDLSNLYSKEKPDWVIVQGDTQTAFVGAQAAFYNRIKIAHVEAGLRTFDRHAPFPEEINRQVVSKLADLHFCPSEASRKNLLEERIPDAAIEVVGNTVLDALGFSRKKIDQHQLYPKGLSSYFLGEKKKTKVVLITSHRRENLGGGLEQICKAVVRLSHDNSNVDFLFLLHHNPEVKKILHTFLHNQASNLVLIPPMSYPDFLAVLNRSFFLLTDSGGLQEEAPSFGKPVLLLRELTERPEGVEAGCVKVVGTITEIIVAEAQELLDSESAYLAMQVEDNPFGDGRSADLIAMRLKNER